MQDAGLRALLADRLRALDLLGKVRLLTGRDGWTLHGAPEIGLRSLVTSDGPSGVRGTLWDERDPSLNVPNATALAATWDGDLVEAAGRLIGAEARKKGVNVLLAPTRLVGFAGAVAEPGQRVVVPIELDARAASRWDTDAGAWTPLAGGELRIGRSLLDIALTLPVGPVAWNGRCQR
jgi:hypothetical protein